MLCVCLRCVCSRGDGPPSVRLGLQRKPGETEPWRQLPPSDQPPPLPKVRSEPGGLQIPPENPPVFTGYPLHLAIVRSLAFTVLFILLFLFLLPSLLLISIILCTVMHFIQYFCTLPVLYLCSLFASCL